MFSLSQYNRILMNFDLKIPVMNDGYSSSNLLFASGTEFLAVP